MKALITGITGQDGSYLAKFLLEKGYKVFGLYRNEKANILQVPAVNGDRRHRRGNISFLKVFMQYTVETLRLTFKERITKQCTKR